jgi:hypothetical protein
LRLEEIYYSEDRKGPFKLYVYRPDGYHTGGQWFMKVPRYPDPPDNELNYAQAKTIVEAAMEQGLEVRICDWGDFLVFHAQHGTVLHPTNHDFWKEIESA